VLVRPPVRSFWEAPAPPESDHFWSSFEVVETAPKLPPGRIAFVGDDARAAAALKIVDVNPPRLVRALDALRGRLPGRGESSRRLRAPGAPAAVPRRGLERAGPAPRFPRRHPAGRRRDAVQEHRRARQARGDPPPRELREAGAARGISPGRCGRVVRRLRL
jgi:hypothetical protein